MSDFWWSAECLGDSRGSVTVYGAGDWVGVALSERLAGSLRGMTGYLSLEQARDLCALLLAHGYGPKPDAEGEGRA